VSSKWKWLAALAVFALLWCGQVALDYFDPGSIPHVSMQYSLKMFGSAIYDYRAAHGSWPSSLDDLAQTSLPQRSRVWRQTATTLTLLWPKDLKPDPKDNARVLLAYTDVGLFNRLGRVWVLWGDLRTEHLPEWDLRATLARSGHPDGAGIDGRAR
jgi:hypothetical protein